MDVSESGNGSGGGSEAMVVEGGPVPKETESRGGMTSGTGMGCSGAIGGPVGEE